jgi:hypothetical protein
MVRSGTYIGDLLHDGLDALKGVFANARHLLGELRVFATLPLLVGLILRNLFLFRNVLQESDLTDLVTVVVDDVAVVVNLETSAVTKVTSSESAKDIAVLVADLTLLVDTHASHGVDAALLLLRLPALGLTDDVTVLVVDVAILIDLVTDELLDVALGDTTDDVARWCLDSTVLNNSGLVEASEWSLGLRVLTMGKLSTSDDVAFVIPDLALAINLLASEGSGVAFSDATENGSAGVDDVASLVDSAASKGAEVDLLLLLLLPWFGMALDVAVLVDDVTVFIDSVSDESLRIALGELANTVAVVVIDETILDHAKSLVSSEWTLLTLGALVGRNDLAAANDLAGVTMDETFAIRLATSELAKVALNELTDRNALAVDEVALLVQGEAIEDR